MKKFKPFLLNSLLAFCFIPGGNCQAGTVSYHYNDQGQVDLIDGPRTDVSDEVHFEYDQSTGKISSIIDPLGHKWQYSDFDSEGNPTKIIGTNSEETILTYEDGRISKMDEGSLSWLFHYNETGDLVELTTPTGLTEKREYDDARRLIKIIYPDGSFLELGRDALGSITSQRLYKTDGALILDQSAVFDELGRPLSTTDVKGTRHYHHDVEGNLVGGEDGRQQAWHQQYNALSLLVSTTDTASHDTSYSYDSHGQLLKVIDANGGETTFTYDDQGRLAAQQSPDTGLTSYGYDEADNLISIKDARGNEITQAFDALNRVLTRKLGTDGDLITYGYDAPESGASIGHLTSLSRTGSNLAFSYSGDGSLQDLKRLYQVNGIGGELTQSFGRDAYGRLQQLSYGDGVSVTYDYGADGHITRVGFTAPGISDGVAASNITMLASGVVEGMTLGNGIQMVRSYDLAGQLKSLQWGNETTLFAYDGNGNILSRQTADNDTFAYDSLDRLISMNGSRTQSYQYDSVGNRLSQLLDGSASTFSYDKNSNRLNNAGGWSVSLDEAGNTLSVDGDNTRAFRWNELGELQEAYKDGETVAKYFYNGFGQRIAKVVENNTTFYDYDPEGKLVHSSYFSGGTKIHSQYYIWLDNQPLMMLEINHTGQVPVLSQLVYLQSDQLNSPYRATDSNGNVVWSWDHDPFGAGVVHQDPDGDQVSVNVELRFPGQIEDSETGLYYNWNRYYNPETGRYISSDPLGLFDGSNTYGYAHQNPLLYSDPYGLFGWADMPVFPEFLVNGAAGFGDTLSFGLAEKIRYLMGNDGSINKCSSAYSNGEVSGIGLSLAFGGAHLARNALYQTGVRGGLGLGIRRLFSDSRSWGATRDMWSRAAGNGVRVLSARGQSLHHWLIPQRWFKYNAGINYLPLTASFNSWMNGSTGLRVAVEQGLKFSVGGIYAAPITAIANDCGCGN